MSIKSRVRGARARRAAKNQHSNSVELHGTSLIYTRTCAYLDTRWHGNIAEPTMVLAGNAKHAAILPWAWNYIFFLGGADGWCRRRGGRRSSSCPPTHLAPPAGQPSLSRLTTSGSGPGLCAGSTSESYCTYGLMLPHLQRHTVPYLFHIFYLRRGNALNSIFVGSTLLGLVFIGSLAIILRWLIQNAVFGGSGSWSCLRVTCFYISSKKSFQYFRENT